MIILLFLCASIVGCATKTAIKQNNTTPQTVKEETTTPEKKQVSEHPNGWIPGSQKILSRDEEEELKKQEALNKEIQEKSNLDNIINSL